MAPRGDVARRNSLARRSGREERSGADLSEMAPAVSSDVTANGVMAGRRGVDEWMAANRDVRMGRPSDMV